MQKIVITGVGTVCPSGHGSAALHDALQSGRSAVIRNDRDGGQAAQLPLVAPIEGFEAKAHVKPRKSIKLMSNTITTAVAAAAFAVEDAGLDIATIDPTRLGVVCGSEMLYGDPREITALFTAGAESGVAPSFDKATDFADGFGGVFPLWLLKYLPNMAACHIGISQGATGPNNSVVQGDASGLLSIAEAVTNIQRGAADLMLTGGTGSMLSEAWTCNLAPEMFVQSADDPATASRPFDANRTGVVAGEGTGIFLIESAEHAANRSAKPLAEIAGFARVFHRDGDNSVQETRTSVRAIERSIELALGDAGCTPDDIDHVNANAASRKVSDAREAQAIRNVLGNVPVTAIKSYFGNLGAGSGPVEMIASVLALHHGSVPPTLNYETADPDCPVNVIAGKHKPVEKKLAIKLSQSSTGQATAIVLRKCE